MTIGEDVAAQLPEFRDWAESLMQDTCMVGTVEKVWNEGTLDYENTLVPVYEGPCRLRFASSVVSDDEVAGQILTVRDGVLSLPVDSSGAVESGMTVEYVTAALDSSLVGKRFRVKGDHSQTHATARRLIVEEVE